MDPVSILGMAIKGASLALSLAKYLNIIEDKLQLKLEQLAGSELEAGLRSLKQATTSENEATYLLREARNRFNKAISLESDLRLAAAHIGLAICHSFLNDKRNAKIVLIDLTNITIQKPSSLITTVQEKVTPSNAAPLAVPLVLAFFTFTPLAMAAVATVSYCKNKWRLYQEKVNKLTDLQQEAKNLLQTM